MDLPMSDWRFTWLNNQVVPIFTRLERLLVFASWLARNPNARQQALASTTSDHCLIRIDVSNRAQTQSLEWTKHGVDYSDSRSV